MGIYVTLTYSNAPEEITEAIPNIVKLCSFLSIQGWNYRFYPEYGSIGCRLHWHGVVEVDDKYEQQVYKILGKWCHPRSMNQGYIHITKNGTEEYLTKKYEAWNIRIDNEYVTQYENKLHKKLRKQLKQKTIEKMFM